LKSLSLDLGLVPALPIPEIIKRAQKAEELGFKTIWIADEVYTHDAWITMSRIAMETEKIKLGPGVTPAYMRYPSFVAQSLATLDEVSGGRTVFGIGVGALQMLAQHHIKPSKPITTLRESIEIIRRLLDGETVNFTGEVFKVKDLAINIKPKRRIPIYIGAIAGPKTMILAGEIADGIMTEFGCTPEYFTYVRNNVKKGLSRAGRTLTDFQFLGGALFATAKTTEEARDIIRPCLAFWGWVLPKIVFEVSRIDMEKIETVHNFILKGNIHSAIKSTDDELIDKLTLSGTPDEIVERIEKAFLPYGFDQIKLMIFDSTTYREMMGIEHKTPSFMEQMKAVNREILPHFEGA